MTERAFLFIYRHSITDVGSDRTISTTYGRIERISQSSNYIVTAIDNLKSRMSVIVVCVYTTKYNDKIRSSTNTDPHDNILQNISYFLYKDKNTIPVKIPPFQY